jgi:hypothetical protein
MAGLSSDRVLMALLNRYDGTLAVDTVSETALVYNPGGRLPQGIGFATIKHQNSATDSVSALDRAGVFRLSIAASKPKFIAMFGDPPARPAKGEIIEGDWDFTLRNQIMPHPFQGWSSWVCVLNPNQPRFEDCIPLLDSAHAKAKATFVRRIKREQG